MKTIILIILLLLSPITLSQPEQWYVKNSCQGQIEVVLSDNSLVDCLTEQFAIDYEFTYQWSEAINRSLHNSWLTGKKAGIVLIGSQNDQGYKQAWNFIRKHNLPITLNTLKPLNEKNYYPKYNR